MKCERRNPHSETARRVARFAEAPRPRSSALSRALRATPRATTAVRQLPRRSLRSCAVPGFGPAPAEDYSASRYDYRRADTSAPFTSALSAQVHVQFGRPSGSQQARDHLPATSVSTRVTAAGPIVRRRTARRGQRRLMSLRQLRRPSFSIERVTKVRRGRRPIPDAYDSRGRARAEAIAPCPWRA